LRLQKAAEDRIVLNGDLSKEARPWENAV